MYKAVFCIVLVICAQTAQPCGPVKSSQQFCVTLTLGQFTAAGHPHMIEPSSAGFNEMRYIVYMELNRVVEAKHWKDRLNPPPQFCTFENSTTNPDHEIDALLNVWANADAADLQTELNPNTIILTPPPLYPVTKVLASPGPCPVFGDSTCHP